MKLSLRNPLTNEESIKFSIPNEIELNDFNGPSYYMNLCAIYKDGDEYKYDKDYMLLYQTSDIKPEEVIEFYNTHKDSIFHEKVFEETRFIDVYYADYHMISKPTLHNNFYVSLKNNAVVELTFCMNGYSRVENVYLALSKNISVFNAIHSLFSNENISVLKFIKQEENKYSVKLYNVYGRERVFYFNCIEEILDTVINMRLIDCENKML